MVWKSSVQSEKNSTTKRGGHYRWPGWIERIERAGLRRSMSRKACSPDNAACEVFSVD